MGNSKSTETAKKFSNKKKTPSRDSELAKSISQIVFSSKAVFQGEICSNWAIGKGTFLTCTGLRADGDWVFMVSRRAELVGFFD